MYSIANLPCVGEDPKYQSMKNELRPEADTSQLQEIVQKSGLGVKRREKALFLTSLVAGVIPIFGVLGTHGVEKIGQYFDSRPLIRVAEKVKPYADSGVVLAFELPIVLGAGFYCSTGKRKREDYECIVAEALLSERKLLKL